jgi:hypothetical protein
VNTDDDRPPRTYIGLTEGPFKTRYNQHTHTFNHNSKRLSTELSKHVWTLKDQSIGHSIKWHIVKRSRGFNINSGKCNLCIWEKYFIIFKPPLGSLNKRSEMLSTCRHAAKYLLRNYT